MIIRPFSRQAYLPCLEAMRSFTANRDNNTEDEIWLIEHPSVFTLGLAGKPEHLLDTRDIDVVKTERGGQVTYHGPGQLLVYTLLDLKRANLTVRGLVRLLERSAIHYFRTLAIETIVKDGAPGVYIQQADGSAGAKIAALGLKISRGCSFHGIALNVSMDLEPFSRINPCGYPGLAVTDVHHLLHGNSPTLIQAGQQFAEVLRQDIESHR